jgi:pimeloyl-ACP methyl ester carboxylesterase
LIEATNPQAASEADEVEDKFTKLPDGVRVHYQEAGPEDAPVVILTHGFLSTLRDWRSTIKPLAELARQQGHPQRVIALDWVGFGESSKLDRDYSLEYFADFLKMFADTLGIKRFSLVGHSMGGKHSLAFTILHPKYVEKLVLVATDGFITDPWWTHQTQKAWFAPMATLSTKLIGQSWFLKASAKSVYFDPKFYPPDEYLQHGAIKLRQPEYLASLKALNRSYPKLSMTLTGLRARLSEIKVPVQLFWGLQDKIMSISCGHEAQAEIPGAQLYVFDRCGHLPQIEKAAEFNQRVLDFLIKE